MFLSTKNAEMFTTILGGQLIHIVPPCGIPVAEKTRSLSNQVLIHFEEEYCIDRKTRTVMCMDSENIFVENDEKMSPTSVISQIFVSVKTSTRSGRRYCTKFSAKSEKVNSMFPRSVTRSYVV